MRLLRPAQALLLTLALLAGGCAALSPPPAEEKPAPPSVGANAPLESSQAPVVRTPMTEKPLGPPTGKTAQRIEAQPKKAASPPAAIKPDPPSRAAQAKLSAAEKKKAADAEKKAQAAAGKGKEAPGQPPKDLNLDKTRTSQMRLYKVSYQAAAAQIKRPQEWKLKVLGKAGKPLTGAQVRLSGMSPQNGQKLSPAILEAKNLGHGYYQAKGLVFPQAGWWLVTVEVSNQGKSDRAQFNLLLK